MWLSVADERYRACIASAMRIWFTLNIAAVIAEADVSWNGLFIGIWTTLEVSLVFVVACTLCLPKLIQAKGRKFRVALTYASAPFSVIPETVRRKTGTLEDHDASDTRKAKRAIRTSYWEDIELDNVASEDHESSRRAQWEEDMNSHTGRPSPKLNRTSSAASSSEDSQRKESRPSSLSRDGFQSQTLHTPKFSKQQQPWKSAFIP